jgi:hypothetical protein
LFDGRNIEQVAVIRDEELRFASRGCSEHQIIVRVAAFRRMASEPDMGDRLPALNPFLQATSARSVNVESFQDFEIFCDYLVADYELELTPRAPKEVNLIDRRIFAPAEVIANQDVGVEDNRNAVFTR